MTIVLTPEGKVRFSLGAWGGKGSFPDFEFDRPEALDLLEKLAWVLGYRLIRANVGPPSVAKTDPRLTGSTNVAKRKA